MNRKWIIAILVYIGLIALCCIVVYAVPSVRDKLEKTYIAQNGTIDVKDEVSAFIVRDETVYVAARKSKINRLAETDKLVKAKTRVVELTKIEAEEGSKEADSAEGTDEAEDTGKYKKIMEELGDSVKSTKKGITQDSGYVSYYVDGAEAKLSTDALDGLTEKDLKELTDRKAVKVPDKRCGKGYPVFKIVNNSKWYLVYFLSNEDAAKYTVGDTVSIDINGEPVTVKVSRIDSGTGNSKIILSCKSFFDGFLEIRSLDTTVTIVRAEGLVLDDSSIVEAPDGRRGVFVKNKLGEHVFKPIRAKADNGTNCVVFSDIYVDDEGNFVETIRTYDEIIAEPTEDDIASLSKKNKKKDAKKDESKDSEKEDKEKESKDKSSKEKKDKESKDKEPENKDSGSKDKGSTEEKSDGN